MEESLPVFKYHPDPITTRSIVKKNGICPLCKRQREYFYIGRYKLYKGPQNEYFQICPWCLSEGKAEEVAHCNFSSECSFDGNVSSKSAEEVAFRTPGFSTWQEKIWLTHCNEPCAFIGYVDRKYLEDHSIDVHEDIEREAKKRDYIPEIVLSMLEDNNCYQGYLFCCVMCGKYRLFVDSD